MARFLLKNYLHGVACPDVFCVCTRVWRSLASAAQAMRDVVIRGRIVQDMDHIPIFAWKILQTHAEDEMLLGNFKEVVLWMENILEKMLQGDLVFEPPNSADMAPTGNVFHAVITEKRKPVRKVLQKVKVNTGAV